MIDTKSVRKELEDERKRLLREISLQDALDRELIGYGNDSADKATENFEHAKNAALRRNLERLLRQVEDALRRLKQGAYGLCARCEQEIDPARLDAIPYAILCIKCKQHLERTASRSRGVQ